MLDNILWLKKIGFLWVLCKWKLIGLNIKATPRIHSGVRIANPSNGLLGKRVTLFPYSYLKSCDGLIEVGENTSIGEYSYINAVEKISIGKNVLIAPSCHITDANHLIWRGRH